MKTTSRTVLLFAFLLTLGAGDRAFAAGNGSSKARKPVVQKVKARVKQAWSNHQRNKKVDHAISSNPQLSRYRAARISHYMKGVPAPTMQPFPVPSGGYYMAKYGEAKRQAREDTVHYAKSIGQPIE